MKKIENQKHGGWIHGWLIVAAILVSLVAVGLAFGENKTPIHLNKFWGTILGLGLIGGIPIFCAAIISTRGKEDYSTCHCCGRTVTKDSIKTVMTSSDPRHQGTELCSGCFDEKILSERWAHLPGIKWFDK